MPFSPLLAAPDISAVPPWVGYLVVIGILIGLAAVTMLMILIRFSVAMFIGRVSAGSFTVTMMVPLFMPI